MSGKHTLKVGVMERVIVGFFVLAAFLAIGIVIPWAVNLVWPALILAAGLWASYWFMVHKERAR